MIFYFASCFFAAEVVEVTVSETPIIGTIVVEPPASTLAPPGTQHVDVLITTLKLYTTVMIFVSIISERKCFNLDTIWLAHLLFS